MELLECEGMVGTIKCSKKETNAANRLFELMEKGNSVCFNHDKYQEALSEFAGGNLYAEKDDIMGYLSGKFGRLPFADEGIQMHVSQCVSFHDNYPLFMLGRTKDKNVFKGSIVYGSFYPRVGDDIVNRLGEFANPEIKGFGSSVYPHPTDSWGDDVTLWGLGAIHDLHRIGRLYWLVKDMYEDLSKFCSLTSKEVSVLFRDARTHENVVIRDLSRERYEKTIDEICAPLYDKMQRGDLDKIKLLETGEKSLNAEKQHQISQ
jgi:hypothetical protein